MANNQSVQSDYTRVSKILSLMEISKPIALVTISQKTGIKLADIIRYCSKLESKDVIMQMRDNGNIFYKLLKEDYEQEVEELFAPDPEPVVQPKQPIDSRQAILQRRKNQREACFAFASSDKDSEELPTPQLTMSSKRTSTGLDPISADDLLALHSNSINQRLTPMSGIRFTRVSGLGSSSGLSSSTSQKAVFANRSGRSTIQQSRSTFTATPPAAYEPFNFERSDANIKPVRPEETHVTMAPLLSTRSVPSQNNELTEQEVFEKLNITADTPFLTVLSPRPTHELWEACSALVNAGGGVLVLGLRKYENEDSTTYFVKSVTKPEDAIKNLLNAFNDRNTISDYPVENSFIETIEIGRKKVIVMRLAPELFSSLPLYLNRDSFGMRTNQGCYYYRNGKAYRCTEEETKQLWEHFKLGAEIPDWDQTGEILPVQMEHKVKLTLPPVVDEEVRPLSRKVDTYGQSRLPEDIRFSKKYMPHDKPMFGSAPQITAAQNPVITNKQPADITKTTTNLPKAHESVQDNNTIQSLLFAEDIRVNKSSVRQSNLPFEESSKPETIKETIKPEKITHTSDKTAQPAVNALPPRLADYPDPDKLNEIAEPAVEHSRLPATRLLEIAGCLLREARLTPQELADLLNRKLPAVRTKIIPGLKTTQKLHFEDNTYYMEK